MRPNLFKSGLVGAFALALSAGAVLAQPGNSGGSALRQSIAADGPLVSAADGPLVQVRDDFRGGGGGRGVHNGGGFHGGGFHGHHNGFRNGFDFFVGPSYYGDDYYDSDNCRWSRRYHREICY